MKVYIYPQRREWASLCKRHALSPENLDEKVQEILSKVRHDGDEALRQFAFRFDKVTLKSLQVCPNELSFANDQVSDELKNAIGVASKNIFAFHESQKICEKPVETMEGVTCWRKNLPIENVGLYIPGGSAPLFSTVLMLAIPAIIAGCKRIAVCTPCDQHGKINPAVLYTASFLGVNEIYKVGGAQAIAAMAYGTETIQKVDKIFGPGNQFVTKAKELVQQNGMAIDLPAGPSEVLVIADQMADPDFIAADLLSQAEHGPDSQVVLLTDDVSLIKRVSVALDEQLTKLPRAGIIRSALENSFFVLLNSIDDCLEFSNFYAPEHLILAVNNYVEVCNGIKNAGSVFMGGYSCESVGDYASGPNHTLPNNGFAQSYSGVSYDSFVKKVTFQHVTETGIQNIGSTVEIMAEAEQLIAHKNAVSIRLKKLYHA